MQCVIVRFRFFLDIPLNSLARVDILLGTTIMYLAFIDMILALLEKMAHA